MAAREIAVTVYEKIRSIVFIRVLKDEKNIDSLLFWRIHVLFSILFAAVFIGFWAILAAVPILMEQNLWGLLLIDTGLWVLGVALIVLPGISFKGRAAVMLAAVYGLGLAVIFNVGLLSGGPVALFTFSVLAGVLMGGIAAMVSVLINAATLFLVYALSTRGLWGGGFVFFDSVWAMATSGITFVLLNVIASVSVSVLLTGMRSSNEKEKELARSLNLEKEKLLATQAHLEREVREHRLTEESLRASEKKYRRLFDNAPAGIYEIDYINSRFVAVNDILCRLSGYSREEFLSLDPLSFLTDQGRQQFKERYDKLVRGESIPEESEYEIRIKGGEILHVMFHNDYIFRNKELIGARVVVHDLTERKKIEEMMIQTEKMMSVGGLAAGMAHEINNPLAGILQNAQVLESRLTRNLPANERVAKELGTSMATIRSFMAERGVLGQLARIREAGKRAAVIVENMLSFSRKESGLKSGHDLVPIIERSIALASSEYSLKQKIDLKKIGIVREYDPVPPVLCEKTKIQQVIFNIIKNGCQAMAEAGTTSPRLTFSLRAEEDMVRMDIADNGPGMTPGIRKRVFEPFFTTKEIGRGTGLGLSVSYFIIVKDHGGELTVDSLPLEGTRFTIRLPIYPDSPN